MGLFSFKKKACWVLLAVFLMVVCVSLSEAKDEQEVSLTQCKKQCRLQKRFDERQKVGCERGCEEKVKRSEDQERMTERLDEESENPYVFKDKHFRTQLWTKEGRVRILPKFTQLLKGIHNFRVVLSEANPRTFILPNHWDADVIFFVAQGRGTVTLVFTNRRESFNIEQGHVMLVPAGVTAYLINRDDNQKLILAKLVIPVSNPGQIQAFFSSASQNAQSFFNGFSTHVLEAVFKTSSDRLQKIFASQTDEEVIKRATKEQIRALTHEDNSLWPFGDRSSKDLSPVNIFNQPSKESNEFGQLFEIDTSKSKVLQELGVALAFANISQGSMHTIFYNSRATKIAVVVSGRGELEMACPHVKSGDQQHHPESESGRSRQSEESKSGRSRQREESESGQSRQREESKSGRSRQREESDSGRSGQSEESETPIHYQKMSSELRPGTVFIVPPGHPFVSIASQNDNLQIFCFEVNAENNHKFPLAGQKNILKNIEKEAKELTYGSSADEVDSVLNIQNEDFFFRGPRQHRRHPDFAIV